MLIIRTYASDSHDKAGVANTTTTTTITTTTTTITALLHILAFKSALPISKMPIKGAGPIDHDSKNETMIRPLFKKSNLYH